MKSLPSVIERTTLEVGDDISVVMFVVRGSGVGPTLSVLGGIHGDEPEGSLAIQALLAEVSSSELRGVLRAVPVCNPAARLANSRVSPLDGLNLAREFPGTPDGSVSRRIAHTLTQRVINGADLLIDLHSAGRDYVMPFFAGYEANRPWSASSARAAMAFGAPLVWEHSSVAAGRSISAASELGLPSIYVEAPGGGDVSGSTLDSLLGGLRRVMATLGMIERVQAASSSAAVLRGGDGNVDQALGCGVSGLCVTRVAAGNAVQVNQLIAEIYVEGRVAEEVRAPFAGTVMMLRRKPQVDAGQAVAMLGPIAVAAG